MRIKVLKSDGTIEDYNEDKLRQSLQLSGLGNAQIEYVLKKIKKHLYDGISTAKIHEQVERILLKASLAASIKYNIKKALFALGPTGYPFEHFVARVLSEYGYKTKVDQVLQGACVNHEVDVVAEKPGKISLVECKFHNRQGTKSNVKVVLYVYSRFLDIKESPTSAELTQGRKLIPWVFTNTRFTQDAVEYALCKGMRITAWRYPRKGNIQDLIEKYALYPITVFTDIPVDKIKEALRSGIVVIKDILEKKELSQRIFGQEYLRIRLKVQDLISEKIL